MQGGIYDLHIVVLCHTLGRELDIVLDAVDISLVEGLVKDGDILRVLACEYLRIFGNLCNLLDNVLIVRGSNLRTIAPVGLVTVVLLGVVRRGDHHARVELELTNCEAELGHGTQIVEQIYLKAI